MAARGAERELNAWFDPGTTLPVLRERTKAALAAALDPKDDALVEAVARDLRWENAHDKITDIRDILASLRSLSQADDMEKARG